MPEVENMPQLKILQDLTWHGICTHFWPNLTHLKPLKQQVLFFYWQIFLFIEQDRIVHLYRVLRLAQGPNTCNSVVLGFYPWTLDQ